jgi:hypothetical protein
VIDEPTIDGVAVRMRQFLTHPDFIDACSEAGVSVHEGACRIIVAYQECIERGVEPHEFHRHFASFLGLPKLFDRLRARGYIFVDDAGDQCIDFTDFMRPGWDFPDFYFFPALGGT